MKSIIVLSTFLLLLSLSTVGFTADTVPNEIMMPGTQPREVSNFQSPDKCDNCHGGYDSAIYSNEPAFGWRGSAMGNAGRDPIFWATLAIAEQDFDGAGDLCIRCHSAGGWIAGRSTPTDGSGLAADDDDGVDCDTCHKATNPNNLEHLGVMNPPFVANDALTGEGYYGSGMLSLWSGSDKLGPYNNAQARHQWMASRFHRGTITEGNIDITKGDNLCGSCHDVSNSAVGDLAPNSGKQPTAPPVISSKDDTDCNNDGVHDDPGPCLGGPIEDKAAFNNPPYAFGIVERTFSEWKSSALGTMDVRDFTTLPADLQFQAGALNMAYQSAMLAGGTYEDGTVRTFTCNGCHMRADIGEGCNKTVPTRADLPKHDLTGGNYWVWPLIKYQDQQGTLRLGGGLTATQLEAIDAGQIRAEDQLRMAASLEVTVNTLKITNLTGHKLITGYPEGRRMWVNIKWYDGVNPDPIRIDGDYGPLGVIFTNPVDNQQFEPWSILDLHDPNTKIYEVHPAITQEWAATLMAVAPAHYGPITLGYDRLSGLPTGTIADLAAQAPGTYAETFHFVLNNYVAKDNRIPPYGMDCEEARKRNALPKPNTQYGGNLLTWNADGTCSGTYNYSDDFPLNPPSGAVYADITLYYQGTSWEYVQFLNNAVIPGVVTPFLADEGKNFLDAWVKTGMVPPFAMATATWGTAPGCTPNEPTEISCLDGIDNDCDGLVDGDDPDCQQNQIVCSDYTTRQLCNAQPTCRWDNKNKMCINK